MKEHLDLLLSLPCEFLSLLSMTSLEPVTQEAGLLSVTTSGDHIKVACAPCLCRNEFS